MKQVFLFFSLLGLCAGMVSCSSDDDEPKIERKINVDVYESSAPKGHEFYAPESWDVYTKRMLFDVPASSISKDECKCLNDGKIKLVDGTYKQAAYTSTGAFYDVEYNTYTLVVFSTANPFNAYLENRAMYKQIMYNEANSILELSCCFVWEDMRTEGGYYQWQDI